jgi:hypothetical protein
VQFTTRQSRFQHIARIHCAVGFACTNQSMDFVNENQSVAIVFSQVVQHTFQALKPALARGELHCIGATTLDEYRQYIEKDAALERRFQKVLVGEPSVNQSLYQAGSGR